MKTIDSDNFKSECLRQFIQYFNQLKNNNIDNELKIRLQGFINAGEFLKIISRKEASELMEQAHLTVFKISSQERKLKKELIKSALNDDNSDFFTIPAINRKHSFT
jgi:hypothetical protein